jgi:hypothetical protein
MARLGKYLTVCLVVILVVTSTTQLTGNAQTIPKPTVPEFTVRYADNSYDVPTTTSIDPYTGKTITNQGYHVEKISTELSIKNQPFTPFQLNVDGDSRTINLYYNIHIKGHYSTSWNYYQRYNGSSDGNLRQNYSSSYTTVPINQYMPKEGALDIQIEAMVGYEVGVISSVPGAPGTARVIRGENSGWSNIQTVTIGETTSNSTPQAPTPTIPEFSWLVIVPLLVSLFSVAVLVRYRKVKHE